MPRSRGIRRIHHAGRAEDAARRRCVARAAMVCFTASPSTSRFGELQYNNMCWADPSGFPARGDRHTTNAGFLDRPGNQPGSFYVLDKFAQVLRGDVTTFGSAERLSNRHESAIEYTRSGKLPGIGNERLPHTGDDIHFACDEQFKCRVGVRRAYQFGPLHTAAQKQIVSTLGRHTDAHAIAVHVPDGAKRRSSRHEIGSFDLDIGGGEIDLACAPWVNREKRNIPRTGFQSLNHLSGRLEADELDGQTSPAAKFSCQINRYAAELSARRISRREHRVSIVDSNPQLARRRKFGM